MPILSRNQSRPPEVQCVREVRVGTPREQHPAVHFFYTQLLGLKPWDAVQQIPGGWGVGDTQRGLYLQYRHDPEVDPMRRRFVLAVESLDRLEASLNEHGWPYWRQHGLGVTDQCILLIDPAGHRVELRQFQPL